MYYNVCIHEVVHVDLLILFISKTSPDVTPAEFFFHFLDQIKFSNVSLDIHKENLKRSVNFTHFNF